MWEIIRKIWIKACFFFQAEDGIRVAQESLGLGDVYKRQVVDLSAALDSDVLASEANPADGQFGDCLLYTSDAADDLLCVDLGGRRIIKNKILYNKKGRP